MVQYFENQEPDEEIVLVLRKHWLYLLAPFFLGLVLTLSGLFILFLIQNNSLFKLPQNYGGILNIAFILVILFIGTYCFTIWMINYLDLLLLTSKRIVVNEQRGLFKRRVSVLDLDSIQDVSITEAGFLETIVAMGELNIQTAGELPNFLYNHIANPENVQDLILKTKEKHIQNNLNIKVNTKTV